MIDTDSQKIEKVVTRGVEDVFPNKEFLRERLAEGKQLTIYLGIDPTGPTLHMGHMIPLIKLRQLQELGHKIILLIGDFTARIGDPDKSQVRKQLTHEEVLENAKLYKEQASVLLGFEGDNPAELRYNGEWLDRMNFADVLKLASQMTVQRMLDRDMFRKRFYGSFPCKKCGQSIITKFDRDISPVGPVTERRRKSPSQGIDEKDYLIKCKCGKSYELSPSEYQKIQSTPIYLHEFMYPLMQGYDSVAMNVDGEVGGNDQTFNMLVGRDLLKNQTPPKEKFVIPMKLLVDNTGAKMGKTTGNMLSFLDSANEKFKKIMTWSDDMMRNGFELLTDISLNEVDSRLDSDENPRDIKFDLAHAIVSRFHSAAEADTAKQAWIDEVQHESSPKDIPEIPLLGDATETLAQGAGESKSQIRRSFREGAIKRDGEKLTEESILNVGDIIQIGKKRWFKII